MGNIKRKVLWIITLFCLVGLTVSVCLISIADTSQAQFSLEFELSEKYSRGQQLAIPDAYYNVGSNRYKAEHSVTYPSGAVSKASSIHLSETGEFALHYEVKAEDKTYIDEYSFKVENALSSQFSYQNDKVTAINNASLPNYIDKDIFGGSTDKGVRFTVQKGQDITPISYNGIIDLKAIGYSKTNASDKSKALVEFLFTPEENDAREILSFQIVLTDVHDSSNYLQVDFTPNTEYGDRTRVKAAPNGWYGGVGLISGNYSTSGTVARSSLFGQYKDIAANSISLLFDYENNELWCDPINGVPYIVMDKFSDPNVVGIDKVWKGFTTGEVYLTFNANSILYKEMSFTVLNINGQSVADSYEEFGNVKITPLTGNFNSVYDYIVAGENNYFDAFDATAYIPAYGMVGVDKKVYYGEYKSNEIALDNGRFRVENPGIYTIVYTVDCKYGYAKKEIVLTAKADFDEGDSLTYEINQNIPSSGRYDQTIYLYEGLIAGGVGEKTITYKVTKGSNNIELNYQTKYPSFILKDAGEYKIEFTAKDSIGTILSKNISVNCVADTVPYIKIPSLPGAYIIGRKYTFPVATAYYYDGSQALGVDIKVLVNGQDYTNKTYTVAGDFTLVYSASVTGNASIVKTESIPCKAVSVQAGAAFCKTYFYGEGFTLSTTADGMEFSTNSVSNNTAFVNPVLVSKLGILMSVNKDYANFDGFEISITDSLNADEQVVVSVRSIYYNGKGYPAFYIGDTFISTMKGILEGTKAFGFKFNAKNNALTGADGSNFGTIEYFENGNVFTGFSSGLAYMSFRLMNVSGDCKLSLSSLGSQVFASYITSDSTGPILIFENSIPLSSVIKLNSYFTVPAAKAYDVFNDISSITVSILDVDDNPIYSGSISSDYTFKLDKLGSYTVKYTATDTLLNKTVMSCYIKVIDETVPQINLSNIVTTAEVGKEYKVADASVVSGNKTELIIYATDSSGQKFYVNNKTIVFESKGSYTVIYYAVDEYKNFAVKSYKVEVV